MTHKNKDNGRLLDILILAAIGAIVLAAFIVWGLR